MQTIDNKYFWNGSQNLSDGFVIRRMLEYAAFPDLLKLPFDTLKNYLSYTALEGFEPVKNENDSFK